VIILLPMRWYYVSHPTWTLATVLFLYFVVVLMVNWRTRDWALLVYPFYSLFYTLVMVPVEFFLMWKWPSNIEIWELSAFTGESTECDTVGRRPF